MEGCQLLWDLDIHSRISQSLMVTFCTAIISEGSGSLDSTDGDGSTDSWSQAALVQIHACVNLGKLDQFPHL